MYNIYTKKCVLPPGGIPKILLMMTSVFSGISEAEKRKWIMRVNLTTIILITAIMQVGASSFAQKVSLSGNNLKLERIFEQINTQTGYDFLFTLKSLKDARPVSISVKNADLKVVLDQVFAGQPLEYTIEDKSVVVSIKQPSFFKRVVDRFVAIDVRGRVVDSAGNALVGASVKVKGKNQGTTTNAKGEFLLNGVAEDAVLEISYIGYQTNEVDAASDMGSLTMVIADAKLEEVTINAGYYSVRQKDATGSISKISAKEVESQPVSNMLAALQGRMAGVNIIQETGTPGGGFYVQVRGQNSMRPDAGQPLYVIDGVPYATDPLGNGISMTIMGSATSPLANINAQEIASIEVLKDADATAIYGARGANGVVLVTTKKGLPGKTKVQAYYSRGFGQVAHFMDMMKTPEYLKMRADAFASDGITQYPENAYDINGTWDTERYTNWQKQLIGGTADITGVGASLSGGSGGTQFLASTNYRKESTVLPGNFGYTKANVHLGLNHESSDKRFKAGFSAIYTYQDNNQPSTDLSIDSWILSPNAPALYNGDGGLNWENNTFDNPLAKLNGLSKAESYDLVSSSNLSYLVGRGLTLKANLGFTALNHSESSTFPSTSQNPAYGAGPESSNIFSSSAKRNSWILEPQANYRFTLGRLEADILAGATFQQLNNTLESLGASGFSSNSMIYNPAAATDIQIMGYDQSVYKYQAQFARVNLNYDGRYIINLTGRRDDSSRFGPGKRFATFGAVGAAWVFSREALFSANKLLSFGKLRASYGTAGSDQIGNYQYLNTYTPGAAIYDGTVGLEPSRLYNDRFGWEKNTKFEAALEAGFWNDRIFLIAAWYRNRSSNQLVGIPLPGTTGFTSLQANLRGTVENAGLEFTLRIENLKCDEFTWSTSLNVSTAKNKLLSFPNLQSSTYSTQYAIGKPLNIEKVYHFTGVDPQTGLYTFEDVNGDRQITPTEDQIFVKDLNPTYFGGILNELQYKNWQISFHLQFVKQENYNIATSIGVPGTMVNQAAGAPQHWQQPGDIVPAQIYTSGLNSDAQTAFYRYAASDAAIGNASFLRIKNVSISYTLPKKLLPKVQCRIYAEGQNLLTVTSFMGPDPEFRGIGTIPPLRMITSGINLQF